MADEVNIIWSETWLRADIQDVNEILNEAIKDYVTADDKIINIQVKESPNGTKRFWIYTIKK